MSEVSAIIQRLLEIKEQQEVYDNEAKALWRAFYQIADREAGEGNSFRFLDEGTGMVIGRIVALIETIDPVKLEELLTHGQWIKVSKATRLLDEAALEVELDRGRLSKDIVAQAVDTRHIPRKFGPKRASKDELAELEEREAR